MSNTKKKVAVIGTVGLPANYGGFETLTEQLVGNLGEEYDFTVYCSGKKYAKKDRKKEHKSARLIYLPFDANGIQSIIYDSISIIHALMFADVLLVLGVAGAWLLPFVRLFTRIKIIMSIDGIEWKRDKWNMLAKTYLWWAEGLAVKYAHIDISDNESIQDYTALRYGSLSRIVEYGGDHTLKVSPMAEDFEKYPFLKNRYAFKVCRIEPENNVEMVLEAFAKNQKITLVFVGNWNNSEFGRNIRHQYSTFENLHLLDPIYDQQKLDLLRGSAWLYVHGHSAGGTNPSLVEAMYLGLPILAFGVSYNRTTTEGKALYFYNGRKLQSQLAEIQDAKLLEVAKNMKMIADRRYTWNIIAQKYHLLFQEALTTNYKSSAMPKLKRLDEQLLGEYQIQHLKHQRLFYENKNS